MPPAADDWLPAMGGACAVRDREPGPLPDHVRPVQTSAKATRRWLATRPRRQVLLDSRASSAMRHPCRRSQRMGHFIWASMHGVAMLSIDGQLGDDPAAADALTVLMVDRVSTAIATRCSVRLQVDVRTSAEADATWSSAVCRPDVRRA